ncbi:hypothetical protein UFOVP842_51 [uncultured Caudovirales phage]|uniref:Uncharacterized protein n=1 Tax=uncultured Caudovirales phage TaxID=2100421 RepID=A0A6J5P6I5_9CAUD|nr:hypothetical protein UFOVP305_4 [uncultured Caudovirales phage]CAB4151953.1 hypothetical protein UFOVP593_41 [uncultured Caudovirales phage]CAB4166777.1 hypothetical protein UFOVP842_51 [uncultured Caudovirales phage]
MYIEGSVDGGTSWAATWRGTNYLVNNSNAFEVQVQALTATYRLAQSQISTAAANGLSGTLTLHYPVSGGQAQVVGTLGYQNLYSLYYLPVVTTIAWNNASELNAVRFSYGAGTITTGTIKIYGVT